MDIGYARVSTAKQELERQLDALGNAGIPERRIYVDKKSGATRARPGLAAALSHAREGDVLVVHTLDRLGRTVRDTLNLIHELGQRGIGLRTMADPFRIDTTAPEDPMTQLAVVILALFGQMERTYARERAAHARSVAVAHGRKTGRPSVVDPRQARTRRPAQGQRQHNCRDHREDRTGTHNAVPAPAAPLPRCCHLAAVATVLNT